MAQQATRRKLDYLGLLICVLSWGSAFVVIKSAAAHMTPLTMAMGRLVSATAFFLPFFLHQLLTKRVHPRELWDAKWYLLIMALLGAAAFMFIMCYGLGFSTATNASLINATNPIITVFFAALLLKIKVKRTALIPLLLAVGGALLLILSKPAYADGLAFSVGDLAFVINACVWALFSVILIPFNNRLHWAVWGFIINVLGLLMLCLLLPFLEFNLEGVPISALLKVIYAGLICGGLATALWNNAIGQLGIATTVLFNNLNPLEATLLAAVFLHEQLNLSQAMGAALIICSVVIYTYSDYRAFKRQALQSPEPEPPEPEPE